MNSVEFDEPVNFARGRLPRNRRFVNGDEIRFAPAGAAKSRQARIAREPNCDAALALDVNFSFGVDFHLISIYAIVGSADSIQAILPTIERGRIILFIVCSREPRPIQSRG